jgi:hypothetical protein
MTALRWFLSYLLPMLIIASIAAGYFYREQLSSDWYRTLSWPVTQINAVLQQQKLQLNVIEPAIATELTTKKSTPVTNSSSVPSEHDTIAMTSDAQVISEIKSKMKPAINSETKDKPLMHPIESSVNTNSKTTTPLMHRVTPQQPKMPILPKTTDNIAPKSSAHNRIATDKLALAPQTQRNSMPYPQQQMTPPMLKPATPGLTPQNYNPIHRQTPKPPTQFKLNKKQLKLLHKARKAFWTHDLKNAQNDYLALTKQLSDYPDIHGELGNLFYRQRKIESAIKHYTIAAKLLIKHRHYWKLPQIMQIIARFNPAKANEVMQLMHNRNSITTRKTDNRKKGK